MRLPTPCLFLYLQVDDVALVARVGGIGGKHQPVQHGAGGAVGGDADGVFTAFSDDPGGVIKGFAAQRSVGDMGDGATLGQGDTQYLRGGCCVAFPCQAAGREQDGLRHSELHAKRGFCAVLCFGGYAFFDIAVEGAGVDHGGEPGAVNSDLGAVAMRLGVINLLTGCFKDDGCALLTEFQRHHLGGALKCSLYGQNQQEWEE